MGYDLKEVEKVEAFMIRDIILKDGNSERFNPKSDIQVQITIYLRNIPDPQNVSVKLVSNESGFNQIDKRKISKYSELWNIPEDVIKTLQFFTGEVEPKNQGKGLKNSKRMFLDEFNEKEINNLLSFFEENKITIISDILKGRGSFSAQWMLVVQKKSNSDSKWAFMSINQVINHYSKGSVKISPRGSLCIGRLTAQRKGGDNGRETAKMLQFKFDPTELLEIIH